MAISTCEVFYNQKNVIRHCIMHLIGNKAADAVVLKYSLLISEIHCIFWSLQISLVSKLTIKVQIYILCCLKSRILVLPGVPTADTRYGGWLPPWIPIPDTSGELRYQILAPLSPNRRYTHGSHPVLYLLTIYCGGVIIPCLAMDRGLH